ncbi:MAG: glycine zipper 2TM domain-containing protein [Nitrospinota bacterium]
MKKIVAWLAVVAFGSVLVSSCTSPRSYEGAGAGGALGAAAGALVDKNNRWRGAVVGGLLGAAFGGTVTEISARAGREAAHTGRPVAYHSADGWQKVEAAPVAYNAQTRCHKVRERTWRGGKLVKDEMKEVCEGEKTEQTYYAPPPGYVGIPPGYGGIPPPIHFDDDDDGFFDDDDGFIDDDDDFFDDND